MNLAPPRPEYSSQRLLSRLALQYAEGQRRELIAGASRARHGAGRCRKNRNVWVSS